MNRIESIREVIIGKYGDSEFMRVIEGKKAEDVWSVMDELLQTIQMLQPRLYNATIEKLKE
jgi:GGDEF domain-containing protein